MPSSHGSIGGDPARKARDEGRSGKREQGHGGRSQPGKKQAEKDPRIMIAMVGVTGAGKTTFASHASGRKDLKVGHGVDPCERIPWPVLLCTGHIPY